MAEKKYKLRILPLFEQDLNETTDYIAYKLQNPIAANHLIDAVEAAIYERLPEAETFEPFPPCVSASIPIMRFPLITFLCSMS